MICYPDTKRGIFLERPNRFLAKVLLDGEETLCHVKNTGRCRELLRPGAGVWCQHHRDPARKTAWSLITVEKGTRLFNLDSQVPNRLAAQWLQGGGLGAEVAQLQPEQRYHESRFDFRFLSGGRPCFLEVKGVTLETGGRARFPDAPTERGTKHLRCLSEAAQEGYGAFVLFVCQMGGIDVVEPNWDSDPDFAAELCRVEHAGVQVLAVQCTVKTDAIAVAGPVPVRLRQESIRS